MVRTKYKRIGKYIFLRVLLFWICCMAAFATAVAIAKSLSKSWSSIISVSLALFITIGITILFVRWEKPKLSDVGVVPGKNSILRIALGFIVGLLLPGLQASLVLLSGHASLIVSQDFSITGLLLNLLLFSLLSCREELAFRAYPLRSLNYAVGAWPALLIVAIMFGVEHVLGGASWKEGFIGTGVASILYGTIALRTKGIAFPIGIHAAWNFGQWILGFKGEPGIWKVVIDTRYKQNVDTIGFISYLIIMIAGIIVVYFYRNRRLSKLTS